MKRMLVLTLLVALCSVNVHKLSAQDFIDGLYRAESTGEKKPMPLPIIREADVMWEKTIWREIDLRQKINQGFYFPITPHNGLMNLYDVLFDAIEAGDITARTRKNTLCSTSCTDRAEMRMPGLTSEELSRFWTT